MEHYRIDEETVWEPTPFIKVREGCIVRVYKETKKGVLGSTEVEGPTILMGQLTKDQKALAMCILNAQSALNETMPLHPALASKTRRLPKKDNNEPNIVLPFHSTEFETMWKQWKIYRSKEHGFKYKTSQSEQAALKDLTNVSGGQEHIALLCIEQSMSKGWKGFFELKNDKNGGHNQKTGPSINMQRAFEILNSFPDKPIGS